MPTNTIDAFGITALIAALLTAFLNIGLHFRKRRRLWTGFWAPLAVSTVLTFILVFGAAFFSNDGWGWLIREIWIRQITALFFLICLGYVVLTGLFAPARMACSHCQAVNRSDAQYCWQCGQTLSPLVAPERRSRLSRLSAWYRGAGWTTRSGVTLVIAFASGFFLMLLVAAMVSVTQSGSVQETSTAVFVIPTVVPPAPLPTTTPFEFVEVVIAVQIIPRGTIINPNAVDIRIFPAELAPITAYSNTEDVIGRVARTDIHREEVILVSHLGDDVGDIAQISAPIPNRITYSEAVLHLSRPADGEINDEVWGRSYTYVDTAGQTITFLMETTSGTLKPFLMIWRQGELVWLEGQRSQSSDGKKTALTVTLENGSYMVVATRARINNGRTSGTFHISAVEGYVTLP